MSEIQVSPPSMAPRTPSLRTDRRVFGAVAVVALLLASFATFAILTGVGPVAPTQKVMTPLLLVTGATGLVVIGIIGTQVWQIIAARRRGEAGARLHGQIVGLFSVIAVAPAVLVAVIASITLDQGLDRFFSAQTHAVIENSLRVANSYVREKAQNVRGDLLAMSIDLARVRPLFDQDRERFKQLLNLQATIRNLQGVVMVDVKGEVVERATTTVSIPFALPTPDLIEQLSETEPQVAVYPEQNYVAAIVKMRSFDGLYLYAAQLVDPVVISQLKATEASIAEYAELEARRLGIQIAYALMFTAIALIVLLSAVWIGLNFANRLVAPIRRLIAAAGKVSTGDLFVQVPVHKREGDLAQLGETFNTMTRELRTQRDDLVHARDTIDSRRRFTEAVLAAASAGVIGVDAEGRVGILNRSAERLIGMTEQQALGKNLVEIVPELAELMQSASTTTNARRVVQGQIELAREGTEQNLTVRITNEPSGQSNEGYVVTLDDITELVTAQRTSAWADVARRIAHEIKNPLTPIQLSAERLRRKYGKVIIEDRTVFEQCTDTIVRQVDDIRRMVDEFSKFARMPKPVMAPEDVADTVRQVVFLMRVGHPDLDIEADYADDKMPAQFDRRLISQAVTNIIKNATEAISAVPPDELGKGRIKVRVSRQGDDVLIDVIDNGIGLPKESRARLLEPYVTTREKGTGLGLAIVGRVLEDHGGKIELLDAAAAEPGARGAWVRLRFLAPQVADDQIHAAPAGV